MLFARSSAKSAQRLLTHGWLLDFTFTQYDPLDFLGTYGIICYFLFVFKNKRASVSLPT